MVERVESKQRHMRWHRLCITDEKVQEKFPGIVHVPIGFEWKRNVDRRQFGTDRCQLSCYQGNARPYQWISRQVR